MDSTHGIPLFEELYHRWLPALRRKYAFLHRRRLRVYYWGWPRRLPCRVPQRFLRDDGVLPRLWHRPSYPRPGLLDLRRGLLNEIEKDSNWKEGENWIERERKKKLRRCLFLFLIFRAVLFWSYSPPRPPLPPPRPPPRPPPLKEVKENGSFK